MAEVEGSSHMSNRALVIWSFVLTLPVQYLLILVPLIYEYLTVGVTHTSGNGEFGCSNHHGTGLYSCSLKEMLLNPLFGILLLNGLTFGLFSLFFAGVVATFLWLCRAAIRRVNTK
jgi:hypothetical protein